MTKVQAPALDRVFRKRIYSLGTFKYAVEDVFEHLDDLRAASKSDIVDKQFSERIMLAVTQVNGCRYCSYGHSRAALAAGLSQPEVSELLIGEFGSTPQDQLTALAFAEHFAESGGNPDMEAVQRLEAEYGIEGRRHLLAYIRMIMMGNLMGNTFDALLNRLSGKPAPGSTLWQELAVLFGSLIIIPAAMVRRLFRKCSIDGADIAV